MATFHPRSTVRTLDGQTYAVDENAEWYTESVKQGVSVGAKEVRRQITSGDGLPFVHGSQGKPAGVAYLSEDAVVAIIAWDHWSHKKAASAGDQA